MQGELLEGLALNFATNEYRLLIVDSVMALFRTEYVGRGELSERQQVLGTFLRRATQMAEEFNLCVFMVCHKATIDDHSLLRPARQTKLCLIQARVLCLQELTVENQLEDIFWLMLLRPDFSFERVEVRNESPRSWILLVSVQYQFGLLTC